MIALAILLAALAQQVLIEQVTVVPPSSSITVPMTVNTYPAFLECTFALSGPGSGVRVSVVRDDGDRTERGRARRTLAVTSFQKNGRIRLPISQPGEYAIVIDNRLEGHKTASVELRAVLQFDSALGKVREVRELSTGRRIAVVCLSLLCFAGIAYYSARRLLPPGPRGSDA